MNPNNDPRSQEGSGEYLRSQFAGIVIEPLPERMTALVDELRRRRDRRRNVG